jgi:hypothetical protein
MGGMTKTLGRSLGACALAAQLGACTAMTAGSAPTESEAPVAAVEAAPMTPVSDPISSGYFTPGQASRGERRFQQLCADCHRSVEITRSWFSGTVHRTAADLFTVMSMTMPDTSPGSLGLDQYADILAFLLRLNDYPPGEEELVADPVVLGNVPIPAP